MDGLGYSRVSTNIDGTTASVDNDTPFTLLRETISTALRVQKREGAYRKHIFVHDSFVNAIVQTRFPLCDKLNTFLRRLFWDKAGRNGCFAHERLLRAFPSVRMSENKLDVVAEGVPCQSRARFLDISACALIEVAEKIRIDTPRGLSSRQRGKRR